MTTYVTSPVTPTGVAVAYHPVHPNETVSVVRSERVDHTGRNDQPWEVRVGERVVATRSTQEAAETVARELVDQLGDVHEIEAEAEPEPETTEADAAEASADDNEEA